MPRLPATPPSERMFARIDRFECECPACGEILIGGLEGRSRMAHRQKIRRKHATTETMYNPVTSTLRCPFCQHVYQVGMILWPLHRSTRGWDVPADQKPTIQQQVRLRAYAKGFIATAAKRRGDPVNVYVTEECLCPKEKGGWTPGCPVHGWETVALMVEEANQANQANHTYKEKPE